jgi:hypothetical protein
MGKAARGVGKAVRGMDNLVRAVGGRVRGSVVLVRGVGVRVRAAGKGAGQAGERGFLMGCDSRKRGFCEGRGGVAPVLASGVRWTARGRPC